MGEFVTIGHSSRDIGEFLAMLGAAGVGLVADVRRFPHSRSHPVFDGARLRDELARAGIGYRHLPALGGRRGQQADMDPGLNAYWHVQAFHNYADYALGPDFAAGFAELLALGYEQRVALMCAEAVWWRCHRRIIADHLLLSGHAVTHLLAPGHSEPAQPTPGARMAAAGKVIYPATAGNSARESR
ncbi:DUF488 domain-containing protein [Paracoccus sp. (in: a-proteobacteria)]|uniref:DUF488 domain-containing protein n=1 Tax=Paracoccus sp. TaxID=267 RepID=UPI0032207722